MEARLARAAAGAGPGVRQRAARRRGPARVAASGRGTEPAEAEGDRWAGAAADAEQRAFARLGGAEPVGAVRGEGFDVFDSAEARLVALDVDALNARARASAATRRHRYAQHPDEAHGVVVELGGVLLDARGAQLDAWEALAAEERLPLAAGAAEAAVRAGLEPHRVAAHAFGWCDPSDGAEARRLSARAASLFHEKLARADAPLPGAEAWLQKLREARVPCALTCAVDGRFARELLERMGLTRYFYAVISAEDGMGSRAERYLSAAMALQRPPADCLVIASSPQAVTAAHNASMKACAVLGEHHPNELRAADLCCASLADLCVINLRRLFANSGHEHMDLQHDVEALVASQAAPWRGPALAEEEPTGIAAAAVAELTRRQLRRGKRGR